MATQNMNPAPRQDLMPPGMPASGGMPPEAAAVYEQMRQTLSPKEFGDEMLASAEQVDPQAVAEFRQQLEGLELPPEVLDALNDLVDKILSDPENYEETRQSFIQEGVPEELLPEEFDPQFFAAFNMAIDQMIGAPAGPRAFAKGGIAELKPIAKAIASYGRNGDTMLAHITPAEARMLRRRGGSGTTNPHTGLPEFWNPFKAIGKAIKSVGKAIKGVVKGVVSAVKKFASSTIGKLITTVALGFFLGPAAASFLNVTSVAGVAAVSGFVGSAGATLAGGGNLRDALKAGAIGGLTAGAGAAVMGGTSAFAANSYAGPTTIAGQVDAFKNMITPGAAPVPGAQAPVTDMAPTSYGTNLTPSGATDAATAGALTPGDVNVGTPAQVAGTAAQVAPQVGATPVAAPQVAPFDATAAQGPLAKLPAVPEGGTSYFDQAKEFFNKNISPSGIQQAGAPAAQEAGSNAVSELLTRVPTATPAMQEAAYQNALKAAAPGIFATYAPTVGLGIGALGLTGGFQQKPAEMTPQAEMLDERAKKDREMMQNDPGMFSPQGFEKFGAVYNDKGQITSWSPWSPESAGAFAKPTVAAPTGASYEIGTANMYNPTGVTNAPQGMGIYQPYNTSSMYGNIMNPPPVRRAAGGIANLAAGGYPRRNGQIQGPGTETSDDIPAMLSDGEFVMTAKAVRGAGGGSRRDGAKKMYALMHRLEKNATRG